MVRTWAQEVKLEPDQLEVEITYRVPAPFMNRMVAGALSMLPTATISTERDESWAVDSRTSWSPR